MARIQITSSKLLLVEGDDELGFFQKIGKTIRMSDLQIYSMGGKDKFTVSALNGIRLSSGFKELVKSLAIARDAHEDAERAFRSTCNMLAGVHLPVPSNVMEFQGEDIKVGVLVIPPNEKEGSLEDLCLSSIKKSREMECIDSFFQCIRKRTNEIPRNLPKAKIKAFLASREESVPHLGVGVARGYFPLNNKVFTEIKTFLRSM